MTDRIAIETQAVIERLERDIRQLEDELKQRHSDLKRHRKILKLVTNAEGGQQ